MHIVFLFRDSKILCCTYLEIKQINVMRNIHLNQNKCGQIMY